MKIGYPCINTSIARETRSTFKLAAYSEDCLIEAVRNNLDHALIFPNIFRSCVCKFNWQRHFVHQFRRLGDFTKKNKIRISIHPDQFVLINSPKESVVENSVRELAYHCSILDLMSLDSSAKIQIHVGGVYGDKALAMKNFEKNYSTILSDNIKKRLVIENDDRLYNVNDCLRIHDRTGVPILFDSFHHRCCDSGNGLSLQKAFQMCNETCRKNDGVPMADFSDQALGYRKGKHCASIDLNNFRKSVLQTRELNYDLMLEIKDKQISAIKAANTLHHLCM